MRRITVELTGRGDHIQLSIQSLNWRDTLPAASPKICSTGLMMVELSILLRHRGQLVAMRRR